MCSTDSRGERAKITGLLRINSRIVIQGCGPIGLICIAVLRTMGIENIVAADGNQQLRARQPARIALPGNLWCSEY